ncbi:hypothetical protein DRF60_06900 [Chryseobacterium elymi]|uniref:Uncharacterized protein n=1 Tax=Chryseobacterium elymi TaxID=395936 RepID=A0A3D9DMF7_9FLAO|nr:hypothetical protein [Chryseobacterium elymi]REC79021.1 hypothetical protein DRF60_06900 [Chryseobacterium elymi]
MKTEAELRILSSKLIHMPLRKNSDCTNPNFNNKQCHSARFLVPWWHVNKEFTIKSASKLHEILYHQFKNFIKKRTNTLITQYTLTNNHEKSI